MKNSDIKTESYPPVPKPPFSYQYNIELGEEEDIEIWEIYDVDMKYICIAYSVEMAEWLVHQLNREINTE